MNIKKILFENFMVVAILTSEDGLFRNGTCNNIEKLCRQSICVILEPIPQLVAISYQLP